VLVDTSVWIDHFRSGNPALAARLEASEVWCHPFVIGELACGSLDPRAGILAKLAKLPESPLATDVEVLGLLEAHALWGTGLGWVDAHLLASAKLAHVRLWSLDKAIVAAARDLKISVED
jgi:predicted nucleic acid-binding protein